MTVDGADRNHELAGDLGVRVAHAEQAQHLDLAGRQARGIDPRLAAGPARNAGRAERAQPPADQRGQRRGAQLIQDLQRGKQVAWFRAFRQRRGVFVRASRGLPELGGFPPPACCLQRVGMVGGRLGRLSRLGEPVTEFRLMCPVTQPPGLGVDRRGDVERPGMVAAEPGILRAGGRSRPQPLQLVDLHR